MPGAISALGGVGTYPFAAESGLPFSPSTRGRDLSSFKAFEFAQSVLEWLLCGCAGLGFRPGVRLSHSVMRFSSRRIVSSTYRSLGTLMPFKAVDLVTSYPAFGLSCGHSSALSEFHRRLWIHKNLKHPPVHIHLLSSQGRCSPSLDPRPCLCESRERMRESPG